MTPVLGFRFFFYFTVLMSTDSKDDKLYKSVASYSFSQRVCHLPYVLQQSMIACFTKLTKKNHSLLIHYPVYYLVILDR